MKITSIQKVIKVGSSVGVTIPAKDLRYAGVEVGDDVEVTVRRIVPDSRTSDETVLDAARSVLKRYKKDFENLAQR